MRPLYLLGLVLTLPACALLPRVGPDYQAPHLAAPAVWSQAPARLTPLKFTLDFRITGQTAPFFLAQAPQRRVCRRELGARPMGVVRLQANIECRHRHGIIIGR
mgnify:CR=1 FL=1